MSSGRKKKKVTLKAKGVKREDILSNLTLSSGSATNLENSNYSERVSLGRQGSGGFGDAFKGALAISTGGLSLAADGALDANPNVGGLNSSGKRKLARGLERRDDFLQTVSQLSDEQITNLNTSFARRSSEVLRRNAFQGRDQLLLTNRVEL